MRCGAYGITHVVKTIEHGDQVVFLAGKCLGFRDAKVETNLESLFGGGCAGTFDRFVVIVKAKELRFWEGFSHQYSGRALAAPYISNARAALELGLYSLERGYPRTYEVSRIARPEEFLATMKHIFVVLMPAHACAAAEGFDNPWNRNQRAERQLEGARKVSWAVFVRQRKRLFFAQTELARLVVIRDVTASGLRGQPFADIPLICFGLGGKFGGVQGAFGESFVQPQLFANHHHARVHCGSQIPNELPYEHVQFVQVDCHSCSPLRLGFV